MAGKMCFPAKWILYFLLCPLSFHLCPLTTAHLPKCNIRFSRLSHSAVHGSAVNGTMCLDKMLTLARHQSKLKL